MAMGFAEAHRGSLRSSGGNRDLLSSLINDSLSALVELLTLFGHLPVTNNHTRTLFLSALGSFGVAPMKMGAEYEGIDVRHHPTDVVYRMWQRVALASTDNTIYGFFKAHANVVSVTETCPPQILEHLYFHHLRVEVHNDTPPPPRPFLSVLGYWAHLVSRILAYCQNLEHAVAASDKAWAYTTIDAMLELMGSGDAQDMCCLIMIQEPLVMSTLKQAQAHFPAIDHIFQRLATTLIPKYPQWLHHMPWVKRLSGFDGNLAAAFDYYLECLEHGDRWRLTEVAPQSCMAMLTIHQYLSGDYLHWFHTYNQILNKASVLAGLCYFLFEAMRTMGVHDARIVPTFAYFSHPPLPWLRSAAKPLVDLLWLKSMRLAAIVALDTLAKVVRLELECLETTHQVSERVYNQIVATNLTMVAHAVVPIVAAGKSTLHYKLARKVFAEVTEAQLVCPRWVVWQAVFDGVVGIDCPAYHKVIVELVKGWRLNNPLQDQITNWLNKHDSQQ